jgi:hypothetical protein
VNGGYLRGPGPIAVTGGTTLAGVTAQSDAVVNQTGPSTFINFTNGGTLSLAAPVSLNGFSNEGGGSVAIGAGTVVNVSAFQSYGTLNLPPGPSTASPTKMVNAGTSPLYFNGGSRTYIGAPAQAGGPAYIDLHGQNAVVAGGLFVNNGNVFDSTGTGHTVIADYGALVKGAGNYLNPVQTVNGGKFQAGNSPGLATFGSFAFGPGGVTNYVFAINDATGQAGPIPNAQNQVNGWSLVKAVPQITGIPTSGNFTWSADAAHPLTISIATLVNPTTVGSDVPGPMAHFNPSQPYSWPAVQWTGTYSGPTGTVALNTSTIFDTTGVMNPITGTFGWNLDPAGQTLSLNYAPVPEPGTMLLTSLALFGLIAGRRAAGKWSEMTAIRPT